jgi:hypothetical protein
MALCVVDSNGAFPATVVMPSRLVWRAATTSAIASSWPGSQSRMIGRWCAVGAMTGRACHHYDRRVTSRRCGWLTIALALFAACASAGSSAAPTTSLPPAEAPARGSGTVPTTAVPEPTGVPGLTADDPFCSAWAGYAGTLQAVGIAASFGGLSSVQIAAIELVASSRLVEVVAAIEAAWPAELAGEHDVAMDKRIGPYARRAQSAVMALTSAGVTTAELATLSAAWQAALLARDPQMPVISIPRVAPVLQAKVDAAAETFDAAVTPFAQDPSLAVDGVVTPVTDAYLVAHCPDLASSGVGDAL